MTTLAVITHPNGDEKHPVTLANGQKVALRKALHLLHQYVGDRQVAVLSSPAEAVATYAKSVAGHFIVDLSTCEGLLRDEKGNGINDGCDCIDDYLDERFGLIVVIAARDISTPLARKFSVQLKRELGEIHIPGMTHVYVI